jgi:hypothetical protein
MSKNHNITLQITSKASYAVPMRYDVVGEQAGQKVIRMEISNL